MHSIFFLLQLQSCITIEWEFLLSKRVPPQVVCCAGDCVCMGVPASPLSIVTGFCCSVVMWLNGAAPSFPFRTIG
jgi:hypothetical protein